MQDGAHVLHVDEAVLALTATTDSVFSVLGLRLDFRGHVARDVLLLFGLEAARAVFVT
jgi:hypothetical protein